MRTPVARVRGSEGAPLVSQAVVYVSSRNDGEEQRDETIKAAWETNAPSAKERCNRFAKKILLSIRFE